VDVDDVEAAATAVLRGGVVAFPTETFYGLGADPTTEAALEKLVRLKGRDAKDKPLLLLAASLDDVAPWVETFPPDFDRLVAHFWPGPLTLVLPAAAAIAPALVGPEGGVAVRMTSHPLARRLITACGRALTGTSANRSGQPPAHNAKMARDAFGDELAALLDGGETPGGQPSTLLRLSVEGAHLVRPGAVPEAALRDLVQLL